MENEQKNKNLLPEIDIEFLDDKCYNFDIEEVGGNLRLILHEFELPEFYLPRKVDLLIKIPAGYPNASLDMFYTKPEVRLASNNNRPTTADVYEPDTPDWQRWSRHNAQWRSGVDNLRTYLAAIRAELSKGI
jgi:hypothetical protein